MESSDSENEHAETCPARAAHQKNAMRSISTPEFTSRFKKDSFPASLSTTKRLRYSTLMKNSCESRKKNLSDGWEADDEDVSFRINKMEQTIIECDEQLDIPGGDQAASGESKFSSHSIGNVSAPEFLCRLDRCSESSIVRRKKIEDEHISNEHDNLQQFDEPTDIGDSSKSMELHGGHARPKSKKFLERKLKMQEQVLNELEAYFVRTLVLLHFNDDGSVNYNTGNAGENTNTAQRLKELMLIQESCIQCLDTSNNTINAVSSQKNDDNPIMQKLKKLQATIKSTTNLYEAFKSYQRSMFNLKFFFDTFDVDELHCLERMKNFENRMHHLSRAFEGLLHNLKSNLTRCKILCNQIYTDCGKYASQIHKDMIDCGDKVTRWQECLKEMESRYETITSENSDLKVRIRELEALAISKDLEFASQADIWKKHLDDSTGSIEILTKDNAILKKQSDLLKTRNEELIAAQPSKELEQLAKERLKSLKTQLHDINKKNNEVLLEIQEFKKSNHLLKSEKYSLMSDNDILNTRIKHLETICKNNENIKSNEEVVRKSSYQQTDEFIVGEEDGFKKELLRVKSAGSSDRARRNCINKIKTSEDSNGSQTKKRVSNWSIDGRIENINPLVKYKNENTQKKCLREAQINIKEENMSKKDFGDLNSLLSHDSLEHLEETVTMSTHDEDRQISETEENCIDGDSITKSKRNQGKMNTDSSGEQSNFCKNSSEFTSMFFGNEYDKCTHHGAETGNILHTSAETKDMHKHLVHLNSVIYKPEVSEPNNFEEMINMNCLVANEAAETWKKEDTNIERKRHRIEKELNEQLILTDKSSSEFDSVIDCCRNELEADKIILNNIDSVYNIEKNSDYHVSIKNSNEVSSAKHSQICKGSNIYCRNEFENSNIDSIETPKDAFLNKSKNANCKRLLDRLHGTEQKLEDKTKSFNRLRSIIIKFKNKYRIESQNHSNLQARYERLLREKMIQDFHLKGKNDENRSVEQSTVNLKELDGFLELSSYKDDIIKQLVEEKGLLENELNKIASNMNCVNSSMPDNSMLLHASNQNNTKLQNEISKLKKDLCKSHKQLYHVQALLRLSTRERDQLDYHYNEMVWYAKNHELYFLERYEISYENDLINNLNLLTDNNNALCKRLQNTVMELNNTGSKDIYQHRTHRGAQLDKITEAENRVSDINYYQNVQPLQQNMQNYGLSINPSGTHQPSGDMTTLNDNLFRSTKTLGTGIQICKEGINKILFCFLILNMRNLKLTTQHNELEAKVKHLEAKNKDMKKDLTTGIDIYKNEIKEEVANLSKEIKNSRSRVGFPPAPRRDIEPKTDRLRMQLNKSLQQSEHLRESHIAHEDAKKRLQVELEATITEATETKRLLYEREREILRLQAEIKELQETVLVNKQSLKCKLADQQSELESAVRSKIELEGKLNLLNDMYKALMDSFSVLKRQHDEKTSMEGEVLQEMENLRRANEELRKLRRPNSSECCRECTNEKSALEDRLRKLTDEAEGARNLVTEIKRASKEDLAQERRRCDEEARKLVLENEALCQCNNALRVQVGRLEADNTLLVKNIDSRNRKSKLRDIRYENTKPNGDIHKNKLLKKSP